MAGHLCENVLLGLTFHKWMWIVGCGVRISDPFGAIRELSEFARILSGVLLAIQDVPEQMSHAFKRRFHSIRMNCMRVHLCRR